MQTRTSLNVAGCMLAALLLFGCDQPRPPAETVAATAAADAASSAGQTNPQDSEADAPPLTESAPTYVSVDQATLPGTFIVGGVETRTLELKPDGRYALKGGVVWDLVQSTWSLEAGGTHLRLHHDHQQTEDLLFGVESADLLVLLNADGSSTHIRSTLDRVKK